MSSVSNPVFDRLFDDAVPALLAGEHRRDEPPVDGGRWPVSVVAVPDDAARDVLAGVLDEALVHAGPTDPVSGEWVRALDAVARTSPPVRLRLTGVTLTRSGVLVQAEPVDDSAWELMRGLRDELGPLAWYEDQGAPRDIWYSTVLHFAAPLLDPAGLVAWAEQNRRSLQHETVLDSLSLVRFRYAVRPGRRHMAMEHWHRARLAGAGHDTPEELR